MFNERKKKLQLYQLRSSNEMKRILGPREFIRESYEIHEILITYTVNLIHVEVGFFAEARSNLFVSTKLK